MDVKSIVREYREGLARELGLDLVEIILYGSHARGEATEWSDIDVLCVMKGPLDYGELIQRTSRLTARISLEHDVTLSRAFMPEEEYVASSSPFAMNVRREGLTV